MGETTSFTYDELGRVIGAAIDGVSATVAYDPLGRVTGETNSLGRFGYGYVNATNRVQSVTYPNGSSSLFTYFDNTGDQRLREIKHLGPGKALISQFDHIYSTTGEMTSWTRLIPESGPLASGYQFGYDKSGRLTSANLTSSNGAALGAYAYGYDGAGNMLTADLNGAVSSWGFGNTNQVQGFAYDANGNLTADGNRTYEWDGANRLTAIAAENHRSEFAYDGAGRRVRITEKDSGMVTSDRYYVWCGAEPCQERTISGGQTVVTKRFFWQGETEVANGADTSYYYTRDHLGSVRQLLDGNASLITSYDYDP
jgi:YD repeat-containing protein